MQSLGGQFPLQGNTDMKTTAPRASFALLHTPRARRAASASPTPPAPLPAPGSPLPAPRPLHLRRHPRSFTACGRLPAGRAGGCGLCPRRPHPLGGGGRTGTGTGSRTGTGSGAVPAPLRSARPAPRRRPEAAPAAAAGRASPGRGWRGAGPPAACSSSSSSSSSSCLREPEGPAGSAARPVAAGAGPGPQGVWFCRCFS